jgi:uncharacterized membrane protein YoaK (UPF0700 family)
MSAKEQKQPDEYVPLQWRYCVWVAYNCLLQGIINGMCLRQLFRTPTTHFTGTTTRFSIATAMVGLVDERDLRVRGWTASLGAGDHPLYFFLIMAAFTFGAFVSGMLLVRKTDGQWSPIRMDYPSIHQWCWQHQFIVSVCVVLIGVAHYLIQGRVDLSVNWPNVFSPTQLANVWGVNAGYVVSMCLTTCASGMLNVMFMLGGNPFLILRSASMTGAITDIFTFVGSSVRSRSMRYMWRVYMLLIVWFGYYIGSLIGAVIYQGFPGNPGMFSHSLISVVYILAPLWLAGVLLLILGRLPPGSSVLVSLGMAPSAVIQNTTPTANLRRSAAYLPPPSSSDKNAELPTLSASNVLEENVTEFETEGVGMRIYQLPRVDVLHAEMEMTNTPSNETGMSKPLQSVSAPGEYEVLDYMHYFWVCYLCFVAGAINAIAMQGMFTQTVSHFTGLTTVMAFRMQYPPRNALNSFSYTSHELAVILVAFGCGCSMCGFFLTSPSSVDPTQYILRRNDYPNLKDWQVKHQMIISACLAGLFMSYGIARGYAGTDKMFAHFINFDEIRYGGLLFACACAAFSCGILNALTSLGKRIMMRSCHVTGTLNDIGLGLGFALRTGSLRFIWRVRFLAYSYLAYWIGGIIGSLVFYSNFGDSSLLFPAFLMLPIWLVGFRAIILHRMRRYI